MRSLLFLFVFFTFPVIGLAQENNTSLDGVVLNADGAVFSFISIRAVLLNNEEDKRILTTEADSTGKFSFDELPYGKYRIEAQFKSEKLIVKKWLDLRQFKNSGEPLVLVWGPCESEEDKDKSIEITKQELSDLAVELLEGYAVREKDSLSNNKRSKVNLSTNSFDKLLLPESFLSGFELLSEKEIEAKTDVVKEFTYLSISNVIVKNGCAAISLGYHQQKGKSFYADLNTFEFRKIDGDWKQSYKFKSFAESF